MWIQRSLLSWVAWFGQGVSIAELLLQPRRNHRKIGDQIEKINGWYRRLSWQCVDGSAQMRRCQRQAQFVKHPETLVENPGDVRNMLIVDGATARLSYSGTLSLFCHIAFPVE